jgi:hypothetical protein
MDAASEIDAQAEAVLVAAALKQKMRVNSGASSELHKELIQSACAGSTALSISKKGIVSTDRIHRGL